MGSVSDWISDAARREVDAIRHLTKRIEQLKESVAAGEISTEEADVRIAELTAEAMERDRQASNLKDFLRRYRAKSERGRGKARGEESGRD